MSLSVFVRSSKFCWVSSVITLVDSSWVTLSSRLKGEVADAKEGYVVADPFLNSLTEELKSILNFDI